MAAAAGQGGGAKRAAEGEAAGGAPAKRAASLGADKEVGGGESLPVALPPGPSPGPCRPRPPSRSPLLLGCP